MIKAEAFTCLGISFFRLSDFSSARKFLLAAYDVTTRTKNNRYLSEDLIFLARIELDAWHVKEAFRLLRQAEKLISKEIEPNRLLDVYDEYARGFSMLKQYKTAFEYQKKYQNLRDAIYGNNFTRDLLAVQAEHDQRSNVERIESQSKIIAFKEESIAGQRIINITAAAAGILGIGFIGLLIFNIRQRKSVNALLEQRVKERTKELESSYDSLRKTSDERNHALARAAREFKEPLLSLQGINDVAQREVVHPKALDYFQKTNAIIHQLLNVVNRFSS